MLEKKIGRPYVGECGEPSNWCSTSGCVLPKADPGA